MFEFLCPTCTQTSKSLTMWEVSRHVFYVFLKYKGLCRLICSQKDVYRNKLYTCRKCQKSLNILKHCSKLAARTTSSEKIVSVSFSCLNHHNPFTVT